MVLKVARLLVLSSHVVQKVQKITTCVGHYGSVNHKIIALGEQERIRLAGYAVQTVDNRPHYEMLRQKATSFPPLWIKPENMEFWSWIESFGNINKADTWFMEYVGGSFMR